MENLVQESGLVFIDPAQIIGWREGEPFNTMAGVQYGLRYLKSQARYNHLSDNAVMAANDHHADDAVYAHDIMTGIRRRGAIDEPIVVTRHEDKYLLLDGALRLSAIAVIRKSDPEFLKEIPAVIFDGNLDEAISRMIDLNAAGRKRPLRLIETCEAFKYMRQTGVSEQNLAVIMGGMHRIASVRRLLKLADLLENDQAIEEMVYQLTEQGFTDDEITSALTSPKGIEAPKRKIPVRKPLVELQLERFIRAKQEFHACLLQTVPGDETHKAVYEMDRSVTKLTMKLKKALLDRKQQSLDS